MAPLFAILGPIAGCATMIFSILGILIGPLSWLQGGGLALLGLLSYIFVMSAYLPLPLFRSRHGKRIRLGGSTESVAQSVGRLYQQDKEAESWLQHSKKPLHWAINLTAGAVPVVLLYLLTRGGLSDSVKQKAYWAFGGFAAAVLLLFLSGLVLWGLARRRDLYDPKLTALLGFASKLQQDFPDEQMTLYLALGEPAYEVVLLQQGLWQVKEAYQDRWFELVGQRPNGCRYHLRLTASSERLVTNQRQEVHSHVSDGSGSGVAIVANPQEPRVHSLLELQFRLPMEKFPDQKAIEKALRKPPQGAKLAGLTVAKQIRARLSYPSVEEVDGEQLSKAFKWLLKAVESTAA